MFIVANKLYKEVFVIKRENKITLVTDTTPIIEKLLPKA